MEPGPGRGGNGGDANHPPRDPVPTLNIEVIIPHKNPSNFWISLDLPLINYKVQVNSTWSKCFVLLEFHNNNRNANFRNTSTEIYVPLVTLSINDNIKFLEN